MTTYILVGPGNECFYHGTDLTAAKAELVTVLITKTTDANTANADPNVNFINKLSTDEKLGMVIKQTTSQTPLTVMGVTVAGINLDRTKETNNGAYYIADAVESA